MDRRRFIKICGATTALAGLQAVAPGALSAAEQKTYNKVKLVDENGQPIKAKNLVTTDAYIFNYPYKGTPCFLINLPNPAPGGGKLPVENGDDYTWEGGVGANGSVVALTAICSHQLSYPEKGHTGISYYPTEKSKLTDTAGVIVCCEHNRVYDPAQGGKMTYTEKKASPPLASIKLEYDAATDELYAVGVYGTERFKDFFKGYKKELIDAYGRGVADQDVTDTASVMLLSKFSPEQDKC